MAQNAVPQMTLVSENKPIQLGQPGQPISLEYLDPALSEFQAPYVDRHVMRVHLNITTPVGSAGLSRILPQVIARYMLKDHTGPRVDLAGASWRIFQKCAMGFRYRDGLNIPLNTTTDVVFYMRVPFGPPNLVEPSDCRMPLRLFREGGQQIVTWAAAALSAGGTLITVNSGDYQYQTRIIDERAVTDKTRYEVMDYPIDQVRKLYPIGLGAGLLYQALQYVGPTNENAGTPWLNFGTAAPQQVTSRTLQINNFFQDYQIDEYNEHTLTPIGDSAATYPSEDPVNLGMVIPFVNPTEYQSMMELPYVAGFDWQTTLTLGQIPTAALMILAAMIPRLDTATRKTFTGIDNSALPMPNAIKTADGRTVPLASLPADSKFAMLSNILPTRYSPKAASPAAKK
jgi:hypothetical protein